MAKDYDEAAAADMAARMGKNATEADIENVANKMDSMNRGPLAKVWDKVTQLWEAFKSPETPASLKAIIIGGLIYMVSPVDLIPDVIPVVGLLDDAGVIGFVFSQFLRFAGKAAVGAAVSTAIGFTINIVVKGVLTLKKLIEKLIEKSRKESEKRELGNKIRAAKESGNSNTVKVGLYDKAEIESRDSNTVKVGLYDEDDNKVGTATVEADSISDELYEGQEIKLYA